MSMGAGKGKNKRTLAKSSRVLVEEFRIGHQVYFKKEGHPRDGDKCVITNVIRIRGEGFSYEIKFVGEDVNDNSLHTQVNPDVLTAEPPVIPNSSGKNQSINENLRDEKLIF